MASQVTVIRPFKTVLKPAATELSIIKNVQNCTTKNAAVEQIDTKKNNTECVDPPDRIRAVYTDDLDILQFHNAILSRFKYFSLNVDKISDEITALRKKLENNKMYPNEIFGINEEIKQLEDRVIRINSNIELKEYLTRSEPLLSAYSSLTSNSLQNLIDAVKNRARQSSQKNDVNELITSTISITLKDNKNTDLEIKSAPEEKEVSLLNDNIRNRAEQRIKIIDEYLNVARKYINIEVVRLPRKAELSCINCGFNLHDLALNIDDIITCPYCSCERTKISRLQLISEDSDSNSDKNSYEDRENFYKAILRYQGRQTNVIPEEKIFKALDSYFTQCGLPVGSEIKLMPVNKRGRRGETSIPLLIGALKSINYSKYYEHVYLIANHYWGWIPNDITHLEDKLMADYDATQAVYNRIPHGERKAALNTQLRLHAQLLALNHPCQKTDFKIPSSQISLDFFQQMWQIMCKETGVKYCAID